MVPEMKYEVNKMVFESFDAMIEATFRIEDVLKEQGILTKNGNNKNNGQNNNNNKDKGKNTYWNKNKKVVNDRFLDSSKPKDQVFLHLASANQQSNRPRYQERPKGGKHNFTQLDESYEEIFTKLLAHNLVHPYDVAKFSIPEVKPWWWDENAYYKLHNGIGHDIDNCGRFKHVV